MGVRRVSFTAESARRLTLTIGPDARLFSAGDVVTTWAGSSKEGDGAHIVIDKGDGSLVTLPATRRRRFVAWLWRKWGRVGKNSGVGDGIVGG